MLVSRYLITLFLGEKCSKLVSFLIKGFSWTNILYYCIIFWKKKMSGVWISRHIIALFWTPSLGKMGIIARKETLKTPYSSLLSWYSTRSSCKIWVQYTPNSRYLIGMLCAWNLIKYPLCLWIGKFHVWYFCLLMVPHHHAKSKLI